MPVIGRSPRRVGLTGALVCATGLAASVAVAVSGASAAGASAADQGVSRQQQFAEAAQRWGVPVRLLLGLAYQESRWDTNSGHSSTSGGYGPMHLVDEYRPGRPAGLQGGVYRDGRGEDGSTGSGSTSSASTGNGQAGQAAPAQNPPAARTLDLAAELTGLDRSALRSSPAANLQGGAAVLATYQRSMGGQVGVATDPGRWYAALAKYSAAGDAATAAAFADGVYATMATGAERVTDDGQSVSLPADAVDPDRAQLERLALPSGQSGVDQVECPRNLPCEWLPGAYAQTGPSPTEYGSYDIGNRPEQQKIEYIVIHDTEESYDRTVAGAADPKWGASWHYTVRSADGHVAQHIRNKDVAWHAGNWYVNAKSIGIEHEGYATAQGSWFTESMYQSSAKLVRYLAAKYQIPLDRAHILGHDNVPGTTSGTVRTMHWDPGPYWDWDHYFDLLGAPIQGSTTVNSKLAAAGTVLIKPEYDRNRPAFTNCSGGATIACPGHGASAVLLHTQPSEDSPLVVDLGLNPDGSNSTMAIDDTGARASAGQRYAVAEHNQDWIAIWYLGRKAWLHNPPDNRVVVWSPGQVVTPKAGKESIQVYGRAYPEASAYPTTIPYQAISPLQYTIAAGQRYTVGAVVSGEYYRAKTFDGSAPGDRTLVGGTNQYVQVQFGNRVAFVDAADVDIVG